MPKAEDRVFNFNCKRSESTQIKLQAAKSKYSSNEIPHGIFPFGYIS